MIPYRRVFALSRYHQTVESNRALRLLINPYINGRRRALEECPGIILNLISIGYVKP